MTTLSVPQETDLKVRKTIGRGHLSQSRLEEAVDIYLGILRDYPEDVESYLVLGDLYLAGEDGATANQLYQDALKLDPHNLEVLRRIDLISMQGEVGSSEPVPTDPKAIQRLLQKLTGSPNPIPEEDIQRAAEMLDEIIHSPNPAVMVAKNLDQIDRLLPALLELNIRQARADGHPELAAQLGSLKVNIETQLQDPPAEQPAPVAAPVKEPGTLRVVRTRFKGRVALLVPDPQHPTSRLYLMAEALSAMGCQVVVTGNSPAEMPEKPDVVITASPYLNPQLLEHLSACAAARIPVIWDLDQDIEHLPINHPAYESLGLGTQARARGYMSAQILSDLITVPSQALADSLRSQGQQVRLVPESWSLRNPQWSQPTPRRNTVNLGWLSHYGQLEDLVQIRRVIIRVLREFSNAQLVIVGDPQAYQVFETVPPAQRVYMPAPAYKDLPYLLGQIDILMVPLRNVPYNHTQSGRAFLEAGARKLSWISSSIPAAVEWQAGGLVARTPEEWHTSLRQLMLDADFREVLGNAGRQRAEQFEATRQQETASGWLEAIEQVLALSQGSKKGNRGLK